MTGKSQSIFPAASVQIPRSPGSSSLETCRADYYRVLEEPLTPGFGLDDRQQKAEMAYRRHIPFLTLQSLHHYIACITQAMALKIIPMAECKVFLYSAQLLYNSRLRDQKPVGRPVKFPPIGSETLHGIGGLVPPDVNQKINPPSPLPRVSQPAAPAPKAAASSSHTPSTPPSSAPKTGKGIQWRLD